MDRVLSFYPTYQETIFISDTNGIRTIQGCLDLDRWFQEYEIKIKANLYKKFSIFYTLKSRNDYHTEYLNNTFYLRYFFSNIWLQIGITPNFFKKEDKLSFGFLKNEKNYYFQMNFGILDFTHNYIISKKNEKSKDPYLVYPFFINLSYKKIFNGFFNIELEKRFESKKDIFVNDTSLGFHYEKGEKIYLSFLLPLFKEIYFGTKTEYWDEFKDSLAYISYSKQLISSLFLRFERNLKTEPSFSIEYYEEKDTVLFKRIDIITGLNISKKINDFFIFTLGFQDSRKKIKIDKEYPNHEARLILALTINFSKNTSFYIFEGIELDHFSMVFKKINYLHNHTFLTFAHRF